MSPRPYNLQNRRAASEQTRVWVLSATRELIMADSAPLSIEAVARQAGVARMTVYYQFGSKRGLLEALFDDLASKHLAAQLPAAYSQTNPREALAQLLEVFTRFWSSERLVVRRVRAFAALDPDFDQALRSRDARRRFGLRNVVGRIFEEYGRLTSNSLDDMVDVLHLLTSFETFDALAGDKRSADEVTAMVRRQAFLVLGVRESPSDGV